jgi:hypothetical protein
LVQAESPAGWAQPTVRAPDELRERARTISTPAIMVLVVGLVFWGSGIGDRPLAWLGLWGDWIEHMLDWGDVHVWERL